MTTQSLTESFRISTADVLPTASLGVAELKDPTAGSVPAGRRLPHPQHRAGCRLSLLAVI